NIVDFVPPVATFPANVTQPADNNACSSQVDSLTALVSDNCMSSYTVNWTRIGATTGSGTNSANGIYNVDTTTINWQVIYLVSAGNNDTITGTTTVIIQDTQNPTIQNCPSNITVSNFTGVCEQAVTWTPPTISDNCPGLTVTQTSSPTMGLGPSSDFPVGTTTILYTATDASGNTSTCSFTVTVNDTEDPTFTNQITSLIVSPSPNCEQFVDLSGTVAEDNCDLDSMGTYVGGLSFSITTNSGGPPPVTAANHGDPSGIYPVGDYDITFTAHDIHGNTASYTINLVVEDQQNPVAVCQSLTVGLDSTGMAVVHAADFDNGSTDNCGIDHFEIRYEPPHPHGSSNAYRDTLKLLCADVNQTYMVRFRAVDANGNTNNDNTCTVTIVDDLPPVAICQDITVDLATGASPSVDVYADAMSGSPYVDHSSYDNCTDPGSLKFRIRKDTTGSFMPAGDPVTFDCSEVGPNLVQIRVKDNEGNLNFCQSIVTVRDTTPPVAMCKDITVELNSFGLVSIDPIDVDDGSTDDCPDFVLSLSPSSFNCNDLLPNPSHTVTLTVKDVGGNTATCTATVKVEDKIAPTESCQNFTAELDATGNVTVVPDNIDNGSSDNCSVTTRIVSPNMFTCAHVSTSPDTVILTVGDQSGNTSTCKSSVKVVDNIAPVAICTNVIVAVGSNGQVDVGPGTIGALSTDNCGLFSFTLGVDTNRDNVVDSTLMP
ncbi:MAG: HYR domain-containing protein, partial [Gammaproteobacteria bacterium]